MRAVAILIVVLYHGRVPFLRGGFVGVDVFFVISGFVITSQLLRERLKSGTNSLVDFYARRVRRIVPAASLVIGVTTLVALLALGTVRARQIADDGLWSSVFAANIHLAALGTDYLNAQRPPSPLQNYWSLAVEEQFYLVWPVLFMATAALFSHRALRAKLTVLLVVLGASSLAWSSADTARNATAAYYSPATRAWELALGALVAVNAAGLRRLPTKLAAALTWLGLIVIVCSAVGFNNRTPYPGTAATVPVLGAVLIVVGGTTAARGSAEWLLRRWPLQWLGKISYSWYLWHLPILTIARERNGSLSEHDEVGLVGLSLVAAIVTYAIVENPVRMSSKLRIRPLASLASCLALIVATMSGLYLYRQAGAAVPGSESTAAQLGAQTVTALASGAQISALLARSASLRKLPADVTPALGDVATDGGPAYHDGCLAEPANVTVGPCAFGDLSSARTMVLYGDSHAAMWLPAFADYATRAHVKLVLLAHSGCPAPAMSFFDNVDHRRYPQCDEWHRFAVERINAIAPRYLVVTSSFDGALDPDQHPVTPAAWATGMTRLLDQITVPGVKTAVLGDIPYPQRDTADCLSMLPRSVDRCATPRSRAILATNQAVDARGATAGGAAYLSVNDWFCTPTTCPALAGNVVIYQNAYHMTATYSALLSGVVGDALAGALGVASGR